MLRRAALGLLGCLSLTVVAPALSFAQDKKVTIRIASAFEQTTDMMQAAKRFADLVKERSQDNIEVKLFAGGQMGGEKDIVEALKLGELEMGVLGTYPIVSLTPKYSFFDAPFVFRDKEHVYKAWSGKLGDEVRDNFKKNHGIRAIGMMGRGYRHITSNTPINSVDDLKGMKIRMGQSKPFIDAFSATGAVVVPIALPELFTSLKLGVVSASDGPFDQIASFKLQEAQKYIALTGHLYATSLWLMNDRFYEGLSAKQKEVVNQAAKEALAYGDELAAASEKALGEKLQQAGMQFTKPDYAAFMAKAKPAADKLFSEQWSVTTADEIANIR
ncbi:TRAP transporter substrate-binding protein [Microvirga subterranea]|uniref:Tripartite ATP-independent transporter DctP family solute receptor n=1 Tax=Microvirga subterranea TaxID=186651 RepID=A0A370H854_9HYPH|nr:TRAP transporter substrate-binding protein [Microvirga subterranea]RDI50491.1 tripartite ATP-independent transporter DctP family solute receptor [Microvirga subterranea]